MKIKLLMFSLLLCFSNISLVASDKKKKGKKGSARAKVETEMKNNEDQLINCVDCGEKVKQSEARSHFSNPDHIDKAFAAMALKGAVLIPISRGVVRNANQKK